VKKARDFIATIVASQIYRSGRQFSVDEIQRAINCLKDISVSRTRQLLNRMVDDGLLDKIEIDVGHQVIEYRKRSSSRDMLSRLWANPVSSEYSPRWC
jgi:hypothetical protein